MSGRRIEFRGVTFGYYRQTPVVHDVSLNVESGLTLVLGPIGMNRDGGNHEDAARFDGGRVFRAEDKRNQLHARGGECAADSHRPCDCQEQSHSK